MWRPSARYTAMRCNCSRCGAGSDGVSQGRLPLSGRIGGSLGGPSQFCRGSRAFRSSAALWMGAGGLPGAATQNATDYAVRKSPLENNFILPSDAERHALKLFPMYSEKAVAGNAGYGLFISQCHAVFWLLHSLPRKRALPGPGTCAKCFFVLSVLVDARGGVPSLQSARLCRGELAEKRGLFFCFPAARGDIGPVQQVFLTDRSVFDMDGSFFHRGGRLAD